MVQTGLVQTESKPERKATAKDEIENTNTPGMDAGVGIKQGLAAGAMTAMSNKPDYVVTRGLLEFSDLSDEEYRVYEWPDGSRIQLVSPLKLNVSKSGGHRVLTVDGISHYIPSGWNHLFWLSKPGMPRFAF